MRFLPLASLGAALAICSPQIVAQLPTPDPIPRTAPRAAWTLTPGIGGGFAQRRDNPGAASLDKMWVFGGRAGNAGTFVHNALYEFDGSFWFVLTTDGDPTSPLGRGGACVAWDWHREKLVVYGGDNGVGVRFSDVWEWDPLQFVWNDVTPAGSIGPGPRHYAAMSYDPATRAMILFGGTDGVVEFGDTWSFANGVWTQLSPTTSPPARREHSLVTRRDFGDVVLCAGQSLASTPATRYFDVWRFDGATSNWSEIVPTTPVVPAATIANQAVYDELRQRIVLQGGVGNSVDTSGRYGNEYGGEPTGWCSEFDCVSNEWKLYGDASFDAADPVIGRTARYFAAYVPTLGKVYKISGQNPTGVGTITQTCEYQAAPVASVVSVGNGCDGLQLSASDRPWTSRTLGLELSGLQSGALTAGFIGFGALPIAIPISPILPGCATLLIEIAVGIPLVGAGGTASFALPLLDSPAILGLTPYVHALQVQSAGLSITRVSSSNALRLNLGAM